MRRSGEHANRVQEPSPERGVVWYERLPRWWKWRVLEPQQWYVPEFAGLYAEIRDKTGRLLAALDDGWIYAYYDYRWDGASGAVDRGLMLASLIHDILYQMIREGMIGPKRWARRIADLVMRRISKYQAAGKSRRVRALAWVRRWADWAGVRIGGWRAVRPPRVEG